MARLLIADDNEGVRESLKTTLAKHEGWIICGEAANGRRAVLLAAELKPDAVILDLAMPMLNGIGAAADIAKLLPSTPIILYTMHKNDQLDAAAAEIGIRYVISKDEPFEKLIGAIEDALAGEKAVGPLGIPEKTGAASNPLDDAVRGSGADVPGMSAVREG